MSLKTIQVQKSEIPDGASFNCDKFLDPWLWSENGLLFQCCHGDVVNNTANTAKTA